MKRFNKKIKFQQACALLGDFNLQITPEIRQKTLLELENMIKKGKKRLFCFAKIGPWEILCLELLNNLRKKYRYLRMVHFRRAGERTFTHEEAESFVRIFKNEKPVEHYVFDGIFQCDEDWRNNAETTNIDRLRIMLKHVSIAIVWFDPNLYKSLPYLKPLTNRADLIQYHNIMQALFMSHEYVQGLAVKIKNLALP